MIRSLAISNYALIDRLELDFSEGFNIITGETGAGKSIMLGALSMLLGNRADSRVVTDKEKKSVVEAVFDIAGYDAPLRLMKENDIEESPDSLVLLRREISPTGRSRSFINDTPVQLSLMREFAVTLVDIHSQHQSLLLSTPAYQLEIIDSLLPDKTVVETYVESFETYRKALHRYHQARKALENSRADEEYLRFQLAQLDELNPIAGEQEELEREHELLANVNETKASLATILNALSDGETNVATMLRIAADHAVSLPLDDAEETARRLEAIRIEALDIASSLSSVADRLEADPRRLEYIEQRIADITELERKHGVDSDTRLIEIRNQLSARLSALDNSDEHLAHLADEARAAKARTTKCAADLTDARRKVADTFIARLVECATPLGMANLRAKVQFSPIPLSRSGADEIEFLFAFNQGTELMPLRNTASGGEISRLMLAVKAIVAQRLHLPTILFDEIDTGVSGEIANRMGALMKKIADRIQVIAITHLPQVAAQGSTHFKVYKEDTPTTTNTRVNHLDTDARISEIALMISGDARNEDARRTAISLLNAK